MAKRFACDIFGKMKKTFEAFEALGGRERLKRLKRLLKFPYDNRGASRKETRRFITIKSDLRNKSPFRNYFENILKKVDKMFGSVKNYSYLCNVIQKDTESSAQAGGNG